MSYQARPTPYGHQVTFVFDAPKPGRKAIRRALFGRWPGAKLMLAGLLTGGVSAVVFHQAFRAGYHCMPLFYMPKPLESIGLGAAKVALGALFQALLSIGTLSLLVGALLGRYVLSRGYHEALGYTPSGHLFLREAMVEAVTTLAGGLILAELVAMAWLDRGMFSGNYGPKTNATIFGLWSATQSRVVVQIGASLANGQGVDIGQLSAIVLILGFGWRIVLPLAQLGLVCWLAGRARSAKSLAIRLAVGVSSVVLLQTIWWVGRYLFDRSTEPSGPLSFLRHLFVEPDVILGLIVCGVTLKALGADLPGSHIGTRWTESS